MTAVNHATAHSLQDPGRTAGRAEPMAAGTQVPAAPLAVLDLVWTASLRALGEGATYASAVLRIEASWPADQGEGDAERDMELSAAVIASAREMPIALPMPLRASIEQREGWTHLRIRHGGEVVVLASFQQGRLVYCTGALPQLAGLRGGTYDSPTGTLDVCAGSA